MKKNGKIIVLNIAHRHRDHVVLGEEGLATLRLLLGMGRREHTNWLRKHVKDNEWTNYLRHADKYVERLIDSAKKVTVEVDWDKWADIEKELVAENKRLNK